LKKRIYYGLKLFRRGGSNPSFTASNRNCYCGFFISRKIDFYGIKVVPPRRIESLPHRIEPQLLYSSSGCWSFHRPRESCARWPAPCCFAGRVVLRYKVPPEKNNR